MLSATIFYRIFSFLLHNAQSLVLFLYEIYVLGLFYF